MKYLKIGLPVAVLIAGLIAIVVVQSDSAPNNGAIAGETMDGGAAQDGTDMVLGAEDAPITVIEYASMSCPHCAMFHALTFPDLKKHYIETGKVRYIFRDYPINKPAFEGAMITRCAGPDRFFGFLKLLFAKQHIWAANKDSVTAIKDVVKLGGMKPDTVDQCLADEKLKEQVLSMRLRAEQEYEVVSTPTFIVQGVRHSGAMSFEEFEKVLKPLLP